jgi:hypothetical protein
MHVQPRLVPEKSPQQYRDLQMLIPRMAPRELEHPAAQMDQFHHGANGMMAHAAPNAGRGYGQYSSHRGNVSGCADAMRQRDTRNTMGRPGNGL